MPERPERAGTSPRSHRAPAKRARAARTCISCGRRAGRCDGRSHRLAAGSPERRGIRGCARREAAARNHEVPAVELETQLGRHGEVSSGPGSRGRRRAWAWGPGRLVRTRLRSARRVRFCSFRGPRGSRPRWGRSAGGRSGAQEGADIFGSGSHIFRTRAPPRNPGTSLSFRWLNPRSLPPEEQERVGGTEANTTPDYVQKHTPGFEKVFFPFLPFLACGNLTTSSKQEPGV